MQERQKPKKINPDQVNTGSLTALNKLREYILSLDHSSTNSNQKEHLSDALKVVDCLRFVKVNEEFLRYAFFADKSDRSVYSLTQDGQQYVIRDFNGTALDIFIYQDQSQYPDQKQALEIFITAYFDQVKEFEEAWAFVLKANKADQFINELQFDENTGCLPKRTARAFKYIEKLKKGLHNFDELMQHFQVEQEKRTKELKKKELKEEDKEVIKRALNYFSPYLWERCLYEDSSGKIQEGVITPDFIVDYLVCVFYYQDPRSVHKIEDAKLAHTELKENKISPCLTREDFAFKTSVEAFRLIREEKALVRMISAPLLAPSSQDSLSYMIVQLADPAHERPVKKLDSNLDRTHYRDLTNNKRYKRNLPAQRITATPKPADWKFTKKHSSTLLPSTGKIKLYPVTDPVFLLFNLDQCFLKLSPNTGKPKYVWKKNAGTNSKLWLSSYWHSWDYANAHPSCTVEELREYLRSCEQDGIIPEINELLACFSKQALSAVGTNENSLFDRLNALRVRESFRATLGLQLPIIICTPEEGSKVYGRAEQLADLQVAEAFPFSSQEKQLTLHLNQEKKSLLEQYRREERAAQALVNVAGRSEAEALALLKQEQEFFLLNEEALAIKNQVLLTALKQGFFNLALRLIELGVDLDYYESLEKNKRLFYLVLESAEPLLIEQALKTSVHPDSLAQALLLALKENRRRLTVRLLKLMKSKPSFSFNSWHYQGKTVLDFARAQHSVELMEALKAAGAKEEQSELLSEASLKQQVLVKILSELEQVNKTELEKKVLQNSLIYLQIIAGSLVPEGGFAYTLLSIEAIQVLRRDLIELLNTESKNTYSEAFYASIHACLLALCYWWPTNKYENGTYYSSKGKVLSDKNRVLTAQGIQLDKEEVRELYAETPEPFYPNTTFKINKRDQSYFAESVTSIVLPAKYGRAELLFSGGVIGIMTWLPVALLAEFLAGTTVGVIFACGVGMMPGFLLGVALVALLVHFSKTTLTPTLANPKIKDLLQIPEIKPNAEEKLEQNASAQNLPSLKLQDATQAPKAEAVREEKASVPKNSGPEPGSSKRPLSAAAAQLFMPPPLSLSTSKEEIESNANPAKSISQSSNP